VARLDEHKLYHRAGFGSTSLKRQRSAFAGASGLCCKIGHSHLGRKPKITPLVNGEKPAKPAKRKWLSLRNDGREFCRECEVFADAPNGLSNPPQARIIQRGTLALHSGRGWSRAMRTKGANGVGRFSVEFEVANNDDLALVRRGLMSAGQVRRQTVTGVVDPGAAMLVLPQGVVKQLGLPLREKIKVRYADGRRAQRQEVIGAAVKLLGREDTFSAVVEPKRDTAVIGAIVLEALDLLVDCKDQRLIPRDPSGPIYEIE
jgi:predicted aspartyl protease